MTAAVLVPAPLAVAADWTPGTDGAPDAGGPPRAEPATGADRASGVAPAAPLTRFVGRADTVAAVTAQVGAARLVTLTGPGGSGKTRLAQALCAAPAADRDVCWVELAELDDPALVARSVAAAAGLPEVPGTPTVEALVRHLGEHPVLLVLDNCEHLVDAVAGLAGHLLRACPALRMVATSREPLGVTGEVTWPVDGLSVPPEPARTAAEVAASEAVQLFVDRARMARPSFELTDDNAATVARLCRRLDGQPLALELAAARLRVLPLAAVVERLDDVLSVLVTHARDAEPRHQTLRATLDWSHALLPAAERQAFAAVSVFRGGFTAAAAEAVIGPDGPDGALGLLARLVDKSLVQVFQQAGHERYRLLEVVRQYAAQQRDDGTDEVAARHAGYYLALARAAEPHLTTGDQKDWLDRLHRDHDNLRAALAWAWRHDAGLGVRLAGALGRYCYLRGHYAQGRQWLQAAVTAAAPDISRADQARALVSLGMLEFLQAGYDSAAARLTLALALYDEDREPHAVAEALQVLGSIARERGDYPAARARHEQSLALWRRLGDAAGEARAGNALAFVAWLQDDQPLASELGGAALRAYRELGDRKGMAWALIHLGVSAHRRGDAAQARPLLTQSLGLSEELGFREGTAWCLEQLGLLAATGGEPLEAVTLLSRSLTIHHELGDRWRIASVLEGLAAVLADGADADAAGRLLTAAAEIRAAIGTPVPPCDRSRYEQCRQAVAAALGEPGLAAASAQGHAMSVDEAVAAARAAADAYRSARPPAISSADAPAADPAAHAAAADPAAHTPAAHAPAADATARAGKRASVGALQVSALGRAQVRVAGREVRTEDWTYAKPRELLYHLLERPDSSKADIGLALWPDASGTELRNSFHTCLKYLRRALGDPGSVQYANGKYRIRGGAVDYDVDAFRSAARAALAGQPTVRAIPALIAAADRYPGDYLAELPVGDWADAIRQRLREGFERVLLTLGALQLQDRRYADAAETFSRLIAHDPLLEAAHRGLLRCHAALGNQARVVRQYQQLVALLRTETGAPPAPETTALYERLSRGTVPTAAGRTAPAAAGRTTPAAGRTASAGRPAPAPAAGRAAAGRTAPAGPAGRVAIAAPAVSRRGAPPAASGF